MSKKIDLHLDQLAVETFTPEEKDVKRGTVEGQIDCTDWCKLDPLTGDRFCSAGYKE